MISPRQRALLQAIVLVVVLVVLIRLFPPALRFVEMAARELRYFWWMILLAALGIWLIWGLGRKKL